MAKIMVLPKIGVNMTEAYIAKWVVSVGDYVEEGQHILDAETDKATQEVFSTMSGVIAKFAAEEGDTVEVLKPLAVLVEKGEPLSAADAVLPGAGTASSAADAAPQAVDAAPLLNDTVSQPPVPAPEVSVSPGPQAPVAGAGSLSAAGRVKISPLAKKIASQMGIDWSRVPPAREGERICKEDVLRYAAQNKSAPAEIQGQARPFTITGIRRTIMNKMSESNTTKPMVPLTLSADMTELLKWRGDLQAAGNKVGMTAFLVLAVSRVLKDFPMMNARMTGDSIEIPADINIGVAADNEKGLLVPVIRNADQKGLLAINEELNNKLENVKRGQIDSSDLSGGTFTISNLGMFEIEHFAPIINPPECCILGVGAGVKMPVVLSDGETIVVRTMMSMTLCFDHRIVDGAPAARFLQQLKHVVENPLLLLS